MTDTGVITAAATKIREAERALWWLTDCGEQAASATGWERLDIAAKCQFGASVMGHEDAMNYLAKAVDLPALVRQAITNARATIAAEKAAIMAAVEVEQP